MAIQLSNFDVLTLISLPKLDPRVSARFLTTRLGSRAPWGDRVIAVILRTTLWVRILVQLMLLVLLGTLFVQMAGASISDEVLVLGFVIAVIVVGGVWESTWRWFGTDVRLVRAQRIRIRRARRLGSATAAIEAEMRRRREAWVPYLERNKERRIGTAFQQHRIKGRWTGSATALIYVIPSAYILLIKQFRFFSSAYSMLTVGSIIGVSIWHRHRSRSGINQVLASLNGDSCSACGYALNNPNEPCPARCTECGVRWPLLPPPLFDLPANDSVAGLPIIWPSAYK
jgi:hypothetical protein